MTDEETAALQAEQADLQRKLRARERVAGFVDNCKAIRARLDEIEQELSPVE